MSPFPPAMRWASFCDSANSCSLSKSEFWARSAPPATPTNPRKKFRRSIPLLRVRFVRMKILDGRDAAGEVREKMNIGAAKEAVCCRWCCCRLFPVAQQPAAWLLLTPPDHPITKSPDSSLGQEYRGCRKLAIGL